MLLILFFFKQKTAYEMRISDWSSDVCSSDLGDGDIEETNGASSADPGDAGGVRAARARRRHLGDRARRGAGRHDRLRGRVSRRFRAWQRVRDRARPDRHQRACRRSEEHTSELQSLMRISYAVFCLKKKKDTPITQRKNN